ncbi:MAG: hypothetical protein LIO77_03865, partial [Rikenellaceae bacterium]|nr:hypothetical protein [Rikenellaceae bacterium]
PRRKQLPGDTSSLKFIIMVQVLCLIPPCCGAARAAITQEDKLTTEKLFVAGLLRFYVINIHSIY